MDVSALYLAAARLDDLADDLRGRATHLAGAASTVRWTSTAATACLRSVDSLATDLFGCAGRIDTLAEHARAHARRLREIR